MVDDDFEEGFFDEDDDFEEKSKSKKKSKKGIKKLFSKKTVKKLKKHKKKIIITGLAIIIAIAALIYYYNMPKTGQEAKSDVIARVDGEAIYSQNLDQAYEMFFLITGYPEQYRQIITKENFLEQLISEELLIQEAEKLGISSSDEEAEQIFNNILNRSALTEEEINQQLNTKGFNVKDLKDYYKRQLILTKLVNVTVFNKINISDKEIKDFYDENIDMFAAQEGQIHVSHILVETEDEAKGVLKELQEGVDFKELAKEKSIEPAAKTTGGDLGFFSKGQMVKEFEDAAFALKNVGQLSGPVETQFGWHIIRKEADTIGFDDAKEEIISMLKSQKEQEMLKTYVDDLRKNADIEIMMQEETGTEGIFSELNATEENKTDEEIINDIETEVTEINTEENSCIQDYGVSVDTIIFYYAGWSPRSKAMIPIVNELASEGYDFYMAEIDTDNVKIVNDCFSDVISEHIPEFVCAGSKMMTAGEMSKESLQKFADECVS